MLSRRLRKLPRLPAGDPELEIPGKVSRTEYALTETGKKLCAIIEHIGELDEEHCARGETVFPKPEPLRAQKRDPSPAISRGSVCDR